MEQALIAREAVVKFFKRYEVFIMPALKFILGLLVFTSIAGLNGGADGPLAGTISPVFLSLLLALMFVVVPMNLSWIIIIVAVTMQYSGNMEVAVSVFLFLLLVFLFYARMATKESIIIIFMLLAFRFNLPYLIPIIVGLYFPVTAVIPVVVGVFVQAQGARLAAHVRTVNAPVAVNGDREFADLLGELPDAFGDVYSTIMDNLASVDEWLFRAIVFAMVVVLVHFVSKQSIDYAKEIAIGLGCVMTIFGFIISVLFAGATENIGIMIFLTILCGMVALLVRFFDGILDYQRAETVQFEDDNNFYHVRIVPKVIMTKAQRSVKRIRSNTPVDPLNPDSYPEDENYNEAEPYDSR